MDIRSADRVLLLELPPAAEVRRIAAAAGSGLVVGVLEREAVYEARALLRDFENVMIAPAEENGTVPWRDHFFSVLYAPSAPELTPEMSRVLASGGMAWISGGPVTKP